MSEIGLKDMDFSTQDVIIVNYLMDLSFIFRNINNCLWIHSYLYTIKSSEEPIRKKHYVEKLSKYYGISKRTINKYVNKMGADSSNNNFIVEQIINGYKSVKPSSSFLVLYELWPDEEDILKKISSQHKGFGFVLMWMAIVNPRDNIADFKELAITMNQWYETKSVSKSTFQRTLKLLLDLGLFKKESLRSHIIVTKKGHQIIKKLIFAYVVSQGDWFSFLFEWI